MVQLAGERPCRAVWENELGGLTFEIGQEAHRRFVKWAPRPAVGLDLDAEAERLRWAVAFTPVPRLIDQGSDDEGVLADAPPVDRLVVCHGDACSPNTLIADGRCSGHVDLGALGVADRWADLAIAIWSTNWNYGPGWEPALLEAYGVDPDQERREYYRLLWEVGP